MIINYSEGQDVSSLSGTKTVEWLRNRLGLNDVFIDCGAHYGFISVPTLVGKRYSRAFMIEASNVACEYLEKNLKDNEIKKVEVINALILDKVGEGYYRGGEDPAHGSYFFGDNPKLVSAITIDSLVEKYKIKKQIVIKMDVELAEPLIWEGMTKSLPLIKAVNMEFMASAL